MTRSLRCPHVRTKPARLSFGSMSALRCCPMPIPPARWHEIALLEVVEIFSACDHFAHTISEGDCPISSAGKMNSTAGRTTSWTTAVLPEPPCPMSSKLKHWRCASGTPDRSSSQTALHARANCDKNNVWSRFRGRGVRTPVCGSSKPTSKRSARCLT